MIIRRHFNSYRALQESVHPLLVVASPGRKKLVELFGDIVDLHNVLQAQHKLVLLQQLDLSPLRLQPMVVRPRLEFKQRPGQCFASALLHAQAISDLQGDTHRAASPCMQIYAPAALQPKISNAGVRLDQSIDF